MFKKFPFYAIYVFVLVAACFITAQITYNETDKQWKNEIDRLITTPGNTLTDKVLEVSETVNVHSLYLAETDVLTDGAAKGYVEGLGDRFAMYLSAEEYEEYKVFLSNASNKGIGISTIYDSECEGVYVINVYKGSPAEQSGMVPGDIITHVGDHSVKELGYFKVMNILGKDDEADSVSLTIRKHNGKFEHYEIQKSEVATRNITGRAIQVGENKVGVITINRFGNSPAGEVKIFEEILAGLVMEGCERFVIDLRNSSGGNIETVSQLLDCFLRDGPVFTVKYNSGVENTVVANTGKTKLPYPYMFACLVNENTVCEAEVFAKVLSNAADVKLFGVTTYGKASVQSIFELESGGAVSLTHAKYVPVGSEDFEGIGISPLEENYVDLTDEQKMSFAILKDEEDTQLQAAAGYLCGLEKIEFYD